MIQSEKRALLTEAYQRHANEYIKRLMASDDQEKLELDFEQISLAVRRVKSEEVMSNYHPGEIEVKFLALLGTFIPKQLEKLVNETAVRKDYDTIKLAVNSVELGEVNYPVNIETLKGMLVNLLK